jgi:hypothetical protein
MNKLKPLFFAFFLFAFSPLFVEAIMQNHYILGTNGINSAVKPVKGFVYTNMYFHYHAPHLVNSDGKNISLDSDIIMKTDINIFSLFTGSSLFGGTYGCQIIAPFTNLTTEFTIFDFTLGQRKDSLKFADMYFEPIDITWRFKQFNLYASYGFYAPTGKFKPFSVKNTGFGDWGHQLAVAGTFFFDQEKTLSLSAFLAYEIHSAKKKIVYIPGDNLTIDWGFGKVFKKVLTIGVVGYFEWQTTHDQGREIPLALKKIEDRTYAIGPEIDLLLPALNGQITFRYEHEFAVRARTKGHLAVFSAAFVF